ncbi:hypothetical protein HDU93_009756 [Gonapodya sp. JEL0774]|nr:hypothetical protein HDU93_009756 [Gonapodya sp. JEL0774]
MNLVGDLRYVSKADTASWGGVEARRKDWEGGEKGSIGWWVRRNLALAVKVGNVAIVHAGITPQFSNHGLLRLNAEFVSALSPYPEGGTTLPTLSRQELLTHPLFGGAGPQWTRLYAQPNNFDPNDPSDSVCPPLLTSLADLGASLQIVGHTPQPQRRARIRCGGRVVLADLGISRAYGGGGRLGAVEIELLGRPGAGDAPTPLDACGGVDTVKDPAVCPKYFQMLLDARAGRVRGVYGKYAGADRSGNILVEAEVLVDNKQTGASRL